MKVHNLTVVRLILVCALAVLVGHRAEGAGATMAASRDLTGTEVRQIIQKVFDAQIRAEREHCCDDLAVTASGDVLVYARALAELESMRHAHFKAALSANDGSLLRRIRRLTNPVAAHRLAGWGAALARVTSLTSRLPSANLSL